MMTCPLRCEVAEQGARAAVLVEHGPGAAVQVDQADSRDRQVGGWLPHVAQQRAVGLRNGPEANVALHPPLWHGWKTHSPALRKPVAAALGRRFDNTGTPR